MLNALSSWTENSSKRKSQFEVILFKLMHKDFKNTQLEVWKQL